MGNIQQFSYDHRTGIFGKHSKNYIKYKLGVSSTFEMIYERFHNDY